MNPVLVLSLIFYMLVTTCIICKLTNEVHFLKKLNVVLGATLHKKFGITAKETIDIYHEYEENNIDFTE